MISPPGCIYNDDTSWMGNLQAVPNAPAKLRALSGKKASRQLQPVVGRHYSNFLAANIGETRIVTNTKIQILPLAML
jgi:hypothetical protein